MTVDTFSEGTWPGNEVPGQVVHTLAGDGVPDWVALLEPVARLAHGIASTDFVPSGVRGRPGAVAAAILYGHELGLGPMVSLAGIDIVDGRPQPSAEMMRSLILRRGHRLLVTEASGTRATVVGRRVDTGDSLTITWTKDMAEQAGLAGKDNWRKYPRAMLVARASADVARMLFPDVIGGLTLPDDGDGVPLDATDSADQAAPAPQASRTRSRALAQPDKRPAPPAAPDGPPVAQPSPAGAASPAPAAPTGGSTDAPPPDTEAATLPPVGGAAGGGAPDAAEGGRSETAAPKPDGEAPDQAPPSDPLPSIEEVAAEATEMRRKADGPSQAGVRAMFGVFARRGWEDRDERLAVTSALLGRTVASSSELTGADVQRILVLLPDVNVDVVRAADGTVRAVVDPVAS